MCSLSRNTYPNTETPVNPPMALHIVCHYPGDEGQPGARRQHGLVVWGVESGAGPELVGRGNGVLSSCRGETGGMTPDSTHPLRWRPAPSGLDFSQSRRSSARIKGRMARVASAGSYVRNHPRADDELFIVELVAALLEDEG